MVKLSKNVLNTHIMNLEAFIVEYSPKLQKNLKVWNLVWLVKTIHSILKLKKEKIQRRDHNFPEIIKFIAVGQCWGVCLWKNPLVEFNSDWHNSN